MADHLALQRALCLLRHLQCGPQDRDTLATFVHVECDPNAYPDFREKAHQKRFENDMGRLREWGVATDYYEGHYRLLSYGDFSPVGLPEEALEMVAFLSETFGPGAPHHEAIQSLLRILRGHSVTFNLGLLVRSKYPLCLSVVACAQRSIFHKKERLL